MYATAQKILDFCDEILNQFNTMDSDDMASESDRPKGFIIVECQKPANGKLKRVCVPKSWILCALNDPMVYIVYPDEDITCTARRLIKNEPPGEEWPSYIGEIKYEAETVKDALRDFVQISGYGNIKKQDEESSNIYGSPQLSITSSELPSQCQTPEVEVIENALSPIDVILEDDEAPQASIISPELASSEAPPAADTECVASLPAAVAAPPPVEVTPEDTPVTVARDSLKVKILRKDYGWQSERSENIEKSNKKILKGHKDKSNKYKVKNMEKRASKENRNLNVNTQNTSVGSINTSEATEVDQNKPGFEHIMTKRMELKIKDIRYSSEPEVKRLALNKTNSIVSKASLSENVQKDVHIKFRNLSPSDKELLVNLQNEQNETIEKIKDLQLQLKGLYMKVNKNQETLSQLFSRYQDGPLEAVPLEERNDQDSNTNNDQVVAENDDEDDEELGALIYEEEEENRAENEMESVSDTDFSLPSSPEVVKKRNSNRWTLNYKQPGKGLIQLGDSRVYVSAFGLERCKRTCTDIKTFIRELYKEVFTKDALSICSMTGRNPFVGRKPRAPALHREAQSVILKYALNYAQKVRWQLVSRNTLLQTIRQMLLRFRNKRDRLLKRENRNIGPSAKA